jgi:DNA repair protein RecO
MFLDDTGIVLKVVRYDDTSSVVHIFTRSHGTVPFMVTRPRSRSSALAAVSSLTSPLGVLSFQWNMKPRGTLFRMKDVHSALVWQSLPYHPVKRAIILMLAECLAAMLREESKNTPLFDHIADSLRWLDEADEGYANFHLVFLLSVARALGVAPDAESYIAGRSFDIESALFVPYAPSSPYVMTPPDAEALYRLTRTSYDAMASAIPLSRSDRTRLLAYLERFFTLHLPAFPQLNAPEILETLFND